MASEGACVSSRMAHWVQSVKGRPINVHRFGATNRVQATGRSQTAMEVGDDGLRTPCAAFLDVETELHHVPVLNHVFLSFNP